MQTSSEGKESSQGSTANARRITRLGGRCARCGATEGLSVDHIIPFALGGTNDDSNLQVLCWDPCHREKNRKDFSDIMQARLSDPIRGAEYRQALSRGHLGYVASEETKKKISDLMLNASEEWKSARQEKISASHKGVPLSKEHAKRISQALRGHEVSEETRKKISETKARKRFPNENWTAQQQG